MGAVNQRSISCSGKSARRRTILIWAIGILVLMLGLGGAYSSWALQKYTITPGENEGSPVPAAEQQAAPPAASVGHGPTPPPVQAPHGVVVSPPVPALPMPSTQAVPAGHPPTGVTPVPAPAHAPVVEHAAPAGAHGAAAGGHGAAAGGHGPDLPVLSPTPGVTFVETMINLMDQELHGRTLGWRPNDILFGRFTDNINNYQLGVLEAIRFTTVRLKDSLTRMGDADTYDPDLEKALHLFMNSATSFWFPSAESCYEEAVDHLKAFVEKLKTGKRSFYYRKDNLVMLINNYKDLLGNVNKGLVDGSVSWWNSDDYFYYAKGVAHVYYEILRVVRVGYQPQLATTLYGLDIMDTILHELSRVETMDPWIVLNADLDGFFANHRANLNGPLSETAHLMGVMGQL
jgi:hypothetical protein